MILFGSRARGDYKEHSDIDLAVSGGDIFGFALAVDEKTDTLLQYDVVNLDSPVGEALLENIEKDGKVLYKKFENFCKTLHNLEDIQNYEPPYDNIVLTGLVSLYQICFDQAQKAMKEAMENEGVNTAVTGSPRSIIKEAYRLHMIDDKAAWLNALQAHTLVSHAYNQQTALEIIAQSSCTYLPLFRALQTSIEQNWVHETQQETQNAAVWQRFSFEKEGEIT